MTPRLTPIVLPIARAAVRDPGRTRPRPLAVAVTALAAVVGFAALLWELTARFAPL
ncbi:MAG TPA: hypothetical protein VM491_14820 [Burkholderiaceae bacterium]|nr:hypothetical protein [Burkholderiaceae bacterium]